MDLLVVAACLAAFAGLGALGGRRASGLCDYVLAGRALTLPSFVATLVPTFYGGVLGIGEFTWRSGLSNWTVMALPYYLFAAGYALFLAGRVRLHPGLTISDHLESAYGRPMAIVGAALVVLLALPADELLMTGALLGHLGGLPTASSTALCGALACAALWRGGLAADVRANRLQIVLMYAGFALILPFAVKGGSLSALPAGHLTWTGGLGAPRLLAWWLIAVWTLVDPAFHQRCAAAKDEGTARRGILLSVACWAVFDLMTTTAGLYARAALPDLKDPLLAFPTLADRVLPPAARGLFYAGLAASITAALQGQALQASVALGKDGIGRLLRLDEAEQSSWSRRALPAVIAVSWLLTLAIPSVVGLWYAVGSAAIPGLLLPLLGVYFPALRARPGFAVASSLAGWGTATAWLLAGSPLGIEPMFPGLGACAMLWLLGRPGTKG